MNKFSVQGFAILIAAACTHVSPLVESADACSLKGEDRDSLEAWRAAEFVSDTPDQSARDLAACLGASDPFLRDQMAYEGLQGLLRRGEISETTRRDLIADLSSDLEADDPDGFLAPFAALGLAELARTDRVEAFLSAEEREALVETAARYLESVSDYRGFSDQDGWRHGVAHGADFAMQLTLNDAVSTQSLLRLREAVSAQITAKNGHAYIFGEPGRLARPILFMAARGEIEPSEWQSWFESLADPAPLATWGDAFKSTDSLARLHNLKAFAQTAYINADLSQNPNMDPIAEAALELLKALP